MKPCSYSLTLTTTSFDAAGGTGTAAVTTSAGCAWSATSGADWLSVDVSGQRSGAAQFKYTVASSPLGANRETSLQVASARATVSQSACSISLASQTETVGNAGGRVTLTVAASGSCPWRASSDNAWVTTEPDSGQGAGQLTLVVADNNSGAARTAHVQIGSATITVSQSGQTACSYRIDPGATQVDFPAGTGHVSVEAQSGCEYTMNATASWLRPLTTGPLRGSARVDYEFDAYPAGFFVETLIASLVLHPASAGAGPQASIEQFPDCHILATVPKVPAAGGNVTVDVLADPVFACPWQVVEGVSWLTATSLDGRGDGAFTLTATANTTGVERSATITVGGVPLTVTQLGH